MFDVALSAFLTLAVQQTAVRRPERLRGACVPRY